MLICISMKCCTYRLLVSVRGGSENQRASLAEEDASEDKGSKYDHCYRGI